MISTRARRAVLVVGTATTLVVTGSGVAAAAAPPKPFRSSTIVVQKSIGGIALGASPAAIGKIFGAAHCSAYGCNYTGAHNSYTISASLSSTTKKVTEIVFQSIPMATAARRLRTAKKVGVGSTLVQLKKAYPAVKKSVGPGTSRYYSIHTAHVETQFVLNAKNKLYEVDLFAI